MKLPHDCRIKYAGRDAWLDELVASPRDWLRAEELAELGRWRHPPRRQQWIEGRRLAKHLVCEAYGCDIEEVQILSRDQRRLGVKPRIYVGSRPLHWSLSISHDDEGVLAVLAATDELSVGVDLVGNVPCDEGFRQLWFTPAEQPWLEQDTKHRTALLWGLKEAVYKACNAGEHWTPRAIELLARDDGAFHCNYRGHELSDLQVANWQIGGQLAVLVTLPRCALQTLTSSATAESAASERFDASSWTFDGSPSGSKQEAIVLCS